MVQSIHSIFLRPLHRRRTVVRASCTASALLALVGCNDVSTPSPALANAAESRAVPRDSAKIRLAYLCGNQFRIRNFGADSATVTWQVRGSNERGTILLRGKDSAAFSDTTFVTQQSGAVQLFVGSTLTQTAGGSAKACVDKARLIVITEQGVEESHGLRSKNYRTGTVVAYKFKAKPGFENVLVTLDGVYVPAAGNVTMSAEHVLIASADSVIRLSAQERQLSTAIRAVVTGPDPVAAYKGLIDLLVPLAGKANFEEMVQRAAFVAYDPIADSAAIRHADDVLSNHLFTATPSATATSASPSMNVTVRKTAVAPQPRKHAGSSPALPNVRLSFDVTQATPRDSLESTTVLYVNGIFTSPEKCAQTLARIRTLLRQLPRFRNTAFTMAHFYNRSMWHQYESPEERKAACGASLKMRMPFLGPLSWAPYVKRCYDEHSESPPLNNDVTEALTQYARIQLRLQPHTADANALADTLQQYRSRGQHVLMLPHSQGNLMVQQAVSLLRSTYNFREDRDSIGLAVVPLAAPTSNGWPFPLPRLKPVTVDGDIVPILGGNSWPKMQTPKSLALDAQTQRLIRQAGNNPFAMAYLAMRKIWVGIQLHDVDESYLAGTVATAIRDSTASAYKEMAAGELSILLSVDQLSIGQGRNLPLYMTVYNQNDRGSHTTTPLKGRDIAWHSSNSSAASVDDGGRVTGVGAGTATVWGRTWGDSAPVQYTVQGISTILTGTYAGTWETLDYNVPYIKDSAAMTLIVSGATISGTVKWTSGGRSYMSKILSGTVDPFGHVTNFTLQGPDPEAVWLGKRCIGDPGTPTPNGNTNTGAGGVDCYQVLSLHLSGSELNGTSYGVGPVWNRLWILKRTL